MDSSTSASETRENVFLFVYVSLFYAKSNFKEKISTRVRKRIKKSSEEYIMIPIWILRYKKHSENFKLPKKLILLCMDYDMTCWKSKVISNVTVKLRERYIKIYVPRPLDPDFHSFLHWTKTSGVKIRPAFKKSYLFPELEDMKSWYWEKRLNFLLVARYFLLVTFCSLLVTFCLFARCLLWNEVTMNRKKMFWSLRNSATDIFLASFWNFRNFFWMVVFKVFSTCKTIFKVGIKSQILDITMMSLLQYLDTFLSTFMHLKSQK